MGEPSFQGAGRPRREDAARHPWAAAFPAASPAQAMETALSLVGLGCFVWDVDTDAVRGDQVALRLLEVPGRSLSRPAEPLNVQLLPPEISRIFRDIRQAVEHQPSYSLCFGIPRRDGGEQQLHSQGHGVRDTSGRLQRVVGTLRESSGETDVSGQHPMPDPHRTHQAEMVQRLTDALAQAATVEEVTGALTKAGHFAASEVDSVTICQEEDGQVRIIGSHGLPNRMVRAFHLAKLSDALPLSEVIRTQQPQFITSQRELFRRYPGLRHHLPSTGRTGYAVLPLIAQGTTFGAVALGFAGKKEFTAPERTVLVALSSTIAQSLQRALLYDKTHELAAELQTTMLPAHLPQPAGVMLTARYRPAPFEHEVGGDWYDALASPGSADRTALVVGDVQGHDVQATALMGQLRTALRAYIAEGHPPAAVMARASAFLAELDTERFATCVLAVLDTAADEVEIVRAGHHAPLIRHADGQCTWHRVPGGLPLGPFPQVSYPATRIPLEAGATLLLCTDGLIESRTADIDHGKERLRQALQVGPSRPEPLADHLLRAMGDFASGDDDTALLIARRTRTSRPTSASLALNLEPLSSTSLGQARHALHRRLREWGMEAISDETTLLASELLTNAVRYTTGPITLTAEPRRRNGRLLRMEVTDTSSALPHRRPSNELAAGGRGLLLIEELAHSWGVRPHGSGKSVWVEIYSESG